MMQCIGISLDDAYVLMDVFGSKGWRTYAVPLRFVLAFFDPKLNPTTVFAPWARGVIFCARDGFIVVLPTSTGDVMIHLGMRVRELDRPIAGLFNELSDACPMDVTEMDINTLRLLQQSLHNERKEKPEEWWMTTEPVTIWNGERITHQDMCTRPAVMMTSSGLLMKPVDNELSQRVPAPVVLN